MTRPFNMLRCEEVVSDAHVSSIPFPIFSLFRRPYLYLHETILGADTLDANLRAGVRVYHAPQRIGCIVVQDAVIKHPDTRESRNRRQHAVMVDVGNAVSGSGAERRVVGLDAVAPANAVGAV